MIAYSLCRWRFRFALLLLCTVFGVALTTRADDDKPVLLRPFSEPVFTDERMSPVENLTLERDAATLQFLNGRLALADPAPHRSSGGDRLFAAVFRGSGRFRISPKMALEIQQLSFLAGSVELDLKFSEAVLVFADTTADELESVLAFRPDKSGSFADLYRDRSGKWQPHGLDPAPRLLKSFRAESPESHSFIMVELNTKEHGWLCLTIDAADPEQIEVLKRDELADSVWTKFPANGRSPQDAYANTDSLADYSIQGYRLEPTVDSSTLLTVTAEVDITVLKKGESVLLFDLDPNLRLSSVTNADGEELEFAQPRNPGDDYIESSYVVVASPVPFSEGSTRLVFTYSGKKVVDKVGVGNYFCRSFGWYPVFGVGRSTLGVNIFASSFDFSIALRVPKDFTAIAVGELIERTKDAEYEITRWQSEIPLKVAGFYFGDFKIATESVGDVEVQIYANKRPDDFMRSLEMDTENMMGVALGSLSPSGMRKVMATEISNSLRVMQLYFGPYPYKKLALASIPYSYGQGWPSLIYLSALSFLDPGQRMQLGIRDSVQLTDSFRAHEVSHQWWGHVVGWKSYHDQWLSEGFANFSGNLYVGFRKDNKEYLRLFRAHREDMLTKDRSGTVYETIGPIYAGGRLSSHDHPDGYRTLVYEKGGWVLHMIRMMLYDPRHKTDADHRFKAMMKDFTSTYFNSAASTEDFKKILEKHMVSHMNIDRNGRMDWFFDSWVYGTGIPKYKFKYDIKPGDGPGKFVITGTLTQSGVRPNFTSIVPLYIHMKKKSVRAGWITVRGPETSINIPLEFKPTKVTINDAEEVLALID